MTTEIKHFIEDNITLIENNLTELFHIAWAELSRSQQFDLVNSLEDAGINTFDAREAVLRYAITMEMDALLRPVSLNRFIANNFDGKLGFDAVFLHDYIIRNRAEWDARVESPSSEGWYIFPEETYVD